MKANTSQRIDKWLWAARFYKTRQLCIKALKNSQISINGNISKPASSLSIGDEVRIKQGSYQREYLVDGLNDKRGSATLARALYHETQESIAAGEQLKKQLSMQPRIEMNSKKPDKRELRSGRNLKRNW
jgi:ribosome-associated heat shock protein Hsp15